MQTLCEICIRHQTCTVSFLILICKQDLVVLHLHFIDLLIFRHIHKCSIIDLLNLHLVDIGLCHCIEHQNQKQGQNIIKQHRLFWCLNFFHPHHILTIRIRSPNRKTLFPTNEIYRINFLTFDTRNLLGV